MPPTRRRLPAVAACATAAIPATRAGLRKVLDAAKVVWFLVGYAQAVHAFTHPDADSDKIPGVGYNAKAAKRSWDEMSRFFQVQFK